MCRACILSQVVTEGRDALRRQAARHAHRPSDAEDALQDACVAFLRYYDGAPGKQALAYLMLVVKQRAWALASSVHRRREGAVELTATDSLALNVRRTAVLCERPGPAEAAEIHERLRSCAVRLRRLTPDQQVALVLFALGYSYREIGRLRGWSQTKVNRCLVEGRETLFPVAKGERPSPGTR